MSQHHHDPVEENIETHPVKLAIAVVVGALGLIVGVVLLAYFAVGSHRVGSGEAKANTPEAIANRIAPVVTLAVESTKGSVAAVPVSVPTKAAKATTPVAAIAIPAALPAGTVAQGGGEGTYKSACSACHATGIAGAPKLGDKASWVARVAKGKSTLYEHAIKGFNAMPAKGGNTTLADADVKAAVDFLLAQIK